MFLAGMIYSMLNVPDYFDGLDKRVFLIDALLGALYALSEHHELIVRCKNQILRLDCSEQILAINGALMLLGVDPNEVARNHEQGIWF